VPKDRLEGDKLVVTENPNYSDRANELMAEELREATGAREVERRPPERGDHVHKRRSETTSALWNARILVGITFVVLVIVGAIASLAVGTWWLLPIAIGLAVLGWVVFLSAFAATTAEVESPDPSRAAALEEEGVLDPAGELSERVSGIESPHGDATEDQATNWTPASGSNPDIADDASYGGAQDDLASRAEKREGGTGRRS
jgi:hypothetical protein